MLRIVTLAAAVLVAPHVHTAAKPHETIWWHTHDAAVIGYEQPRQCALLFYNSQQAVIFTWETSRILLQFEQTDWNFPKGTTMGAGVQVGGSWLRSSEDHVFGMVGAGQILTTVLPNDPLAEIAGADHITLRLLGQVVRYDMNRSKMPALMKALHRCQRFIPH